jgi:hypothetical protein
MRAMLSDRFSLVDEDMESVWSLAGLGRGKVFYVHSGSGASTYTGEDKDFPLATVNGAVAKCTASRGDVIVVLPGHAETISTAALSPTVSAAGVSVVGLGVGTLAPTFTITHVDGTFSITGANVLVDNLRIVSNLDNVKVGLTLGAAADGSVVRNCVFRDSAANKDLLVGISVTSACDNAKILFNDFATTAAAGSNNAILSAAVTGLEIRGNTIFGAYATGGILTSAVLTRALIVDNMIMNEAAIAIALNGTTSTGILARNFLGGTTSIAAALTGDNAMWAFENYVSGAAAASGLLNPAVDGD